MCRWFAGRVAGVVGVAFWAWFLVGSAAAEEPPKLRYGFQKDQKYAYDILINLKCMTIEETWKGILVFDVTKSTDDQLSRKVSGRLAEQVQAAAGFLIFPGTIRCPLAPAVCSFQRPETWTISRLGDIVIVGRVNQIPCLLGPEELLVIESLPKEAKMSWSVHNATG